MTRPRIRLPGGLKPPSDVPVGLLAEEQLVADRDTLHEIVAGLDRLMQLVDQTPLLNAAELREYFTPDEDDRVRQALLAYRNYRLAAYEIIFRYRDYAQTADENMHLALDELARAGGSAGAPFQPVALQLRRRDGRAHTEAPDRIVSLLRRIRKGWRPARRTLARDHSPAAA